MSDLVGGMTIGEWLCKMSSDVSAAVCDVIFL